MQWSTLIFASAFFPLLLPATMAKPQLGLPVALTHLSRRGVMACLVVALLTLVAMPHWPLLWLGQLKNYEHFIPLLVLPGPLLALALWRYRDKDAWFLVLTAMMPQRWFFDAFILWLIPKSRREILFTAALSWGAGVWRWYHIPHSFTEVGRFTVLFIYLPMLAVILLRQFVREDTAKRVEQAQPGNNGQAILHLCFWPLARLVRSSPRPILVTFLAAMIVLHAWMFFSLRREIATGYPDFTIFYTAGKCILQGHGRQLYDLETQFALQREFAPEVKHRENALPFNHPPFEALLFVPLARLPYVTAYLVWAAFNLALILGFWNLLRPRLPSLHNFLPALPLLAMFAFFPVIMALLQGQDSILLLFLYGLAFSALATGRAFVAGLCLGSGSFQVSVGSALCACAVGQTSVESSCGVCRYRFRVAPGLSGSGRLERCDGISRICAPSESQRRPSGDLSAGYAEPAWPGCRIAAPGRSASYAADHHAFYRAGGAGRALVACTTRACTTKTSSSLVFRCA